MKDRASRDIAGGNPIRPFVGETITITGVDWLDHPTTSTY